jgi:ABC-type phosphate transport system permease subunit
MRNQGEVVWETAPFLMLVTLSKLKLSASSNKIFGNVQPLRTLIVDVIITKHLAVKTKVDAGMDFPNLT